MAADDELEYTVNKRTDAKHFPPGWFGDGWEYDFEVCVPVNQDAHILKVLRIRGENEYAEREYLSTKGWIPYEGFDIMRNPITMSGLRLAEKGRLEKRIVDAMVKAITVEPNRGG